MPTIQSEEQLSNLGLYIFKGSVTNQYGGTATNIVVQALDGVLHIARYEIEDRVVSFDSKTGDFNVVVFRTAGTTANLRAQAPFLRWSTSVVITQMPTKETTLGKIVPTGEVSGINNLNVIEDELTDI